MPGPRPGVEFLLALGGGNRAGLSIRVAVDSIVLWRIGFGFGFDDGCLYQINQRRVLWSSNGGNGCGFRGCG